ncbi:hypothetical protein TNCV_3278391 [Trichonephila clavipes]|nr:hypothetical protein TNCV_3278391 [Trichonephila clavipes]
MNDAIIEIKMAPHKPQKSTPEQDSEDVDMIEHNPDEFDADEYVQNWKYPRNLESPRVSPPGFRNYSKIMVMGVDVTAHERSEDRYSVVTPKRNRRSTASNLYPRLFSTTVRTVSMQAVYRRLGQIDL